MTNEQQLRQAVEEFEIAATFLSNVLKRFETDDQENISVKIKTAKQLLKTLDKAEQEYYDPS